MKSSVIATFFALIVGLAWAVLSFLVGDELGFDPLASTALLAAPVLIFYAVACIRNGAWFSQVWATVLFAAIVGMVLSLDSDGAGVAMAVFIPAFIIGISIHALLYRPELGFFGKLFTWLKSLIPFDFNRQGVGDKMKTTSRFGHDAQLALLGLVIALQVFDIGLKLMA